jgi:hypothetical protein
MCSTAEGLVHHNRGPAAGRLCAPVCRPADEGLLPFTSRISGATHLSQNNLASGGASVSTSQVSSSPALCHYLLGGRRHRFFVVVQPFGADEADAGRFALALSVVPHALDPRATAFDPGGALLPRRRRALFGIARSHQDGHADLACCRQPARSPRTELEPSRRCHAVWPGNAGIWHRECRWRAEDDLIETPRMGDQTARRELCASGVAMQAEPAAKAGDVFLPRLRCQQVHVLVGIDAPAQHLPVEGELLTAESGRHNDRVMPFGEGCPAFDGRLRVPDQLAVGPGTIRPGIPVGQDQNPNRVAWHERCNRTGTPRRQVVLEMPPAPAIRRSVHARTNRALTVPCAVIDAMCIGLQVMSNPPRSTSSSAVSTTA